MTYTLIRIPLKDLSSCDFNMNVTGDEEAARQYIVSTEDSIIIDQLARLRGYPCSHITEMILIRSRNKNSGEDDMYFHAASPITVFTTADSANPHLRPRTA